MVVIQASKEDFDKETSEVHPDSSSDQPFKIITLEDGIKEYEMMGKTLIDSNLINSKDGYGNSNKSILSHLSMKKIYNLSNLINVNITEKFKK